MRFGNPARNLAGFVLDREELAVLEEALELVEPAASIARALRRDSLLLDYLADWASDHRELRIINLDEGEPYETGRDVLNMEEGENVRDALRQHALEEGTDDFRAELRATLRPRDAIQGPIQGQRADVVVMDDVVAVRADKSREPAPLALVDSRISCQVREALSHIRNRERGL